MTSVVDQVQVSADGRTLWVHSTDGSTVGRFSTRFGMDVHISATEQMNGAAQCLHCTHFAPTYSDWLEFCDLLELHHGIMVGKEIMDRTLFRE